MKIFEVPAEWTKNGGVNTTVMVIDSHIDPSAEIYNEVKDYSKIDNDRLYGYSHGTETCEIIRYTSPFCEIKTIQCLINQNGSIESFIRALSMLKNKKFDVLNLSISTPIDDIRIKDLLYGISKKSIIVASNSNSGGKSFPSSYDFVTSVSSMKHYYQDADFYIDDDLYISGKKVRAGNSTSTALFSGICSLALSFGYSSIEEITQQLQR